MSKPSTPKGGAPASSGREPRGPRETKVMVLKTLNGKRYLTSEEVEQVEEVYGLTRELQQTTHRAQGRAKAGARTVLFCVDDVEAYLAARRIS